mmetsp:Transcript_27017/g.62404  ORF Transcript_27017/g.62404 Transcript_27017/m.62404 type:complete len:247 (+) Transcript_27017:56-796(+)
MAQLRLTLNWGRQAARQCAQSSIETSWTCRSPYTQSSFQNSCRRTALQSYPLSRERRLLSPQLYPTRRHFADTAGAKADIPEAKLDGKEIPIAQESASQVAKLSLEERVAQLEQTVQLQETKLKEVETLARKKGGFAALFMQYGAPFVLWYLTVWVAGGSIIFILLELGVISWQETVKPLLEGVGLSSWCDAVDSRAGNLVIAFVINEMLETLRFPIVLATAPKIIKVVQQVLSKRFPKYWTPPGS